MDANTAVSLVGQAIILVAKLAGPILLATLVVGLLISMFQAVTSVQEFTLTFLPKLVVVAAVLTLFGHWMVTEMVDYTQQLYDNAPSLVGP